MTQPARSICRGWLAALCLVALACQAWGQSAATNDAAERSRIAAERRAVQARFDSARLACEKRFVVTECLDAARADRRQALDQLQRQQVVLDEARRRERAAQRQRDIETRAAGADGRDAQPLVPARPAASATPPAARRPAHAASAGAAASASADAQAQRRRVTFAHRQAAAREHQRAVDERNARHDAQHKPAAGLPLPPAGPASAAPR
jgi:colicin import membrane protein